MTDKYDDSTQAYVQYVSINGKQVSNLSTSKGHQAMGFGSSVECDAEDCGTIGAHRKSSTASNDQLHTDRYDRVG